MGLLPDQFWDLTLREVVWYNHGFIRRETMMWDRTAAHMALDANIAAGGKGKKYTPRDFNPYSNIGGSEAANAEQARELLNKMKQF